MEKILLLIDHHGMSRSAFDCACYLAELSRSALTAIFVHSEKDQQDKIGENIIAFEQACKQKSIRWYTHPQYICRTEELIIESRFADLLIVNAESTLDGSPDAPPTNFVKDVLSRSECPVVVAPLTFTGIEEILFAYDGTAAAVYAIKQFSYLFPKLSDTKLIFLQVEDQGASEIINHDKIGEFLKMHYSAIGYKLLHGSASQELFSYLIGKKNVFVITGAYGRKMISAFFKESTADLLLKGANHPIFIAHH